MLESYIDLDIAFGPADGVEDRDGRALAAELMRDGGAATITEHHESTGLVPIFGLVALIAVTTRSAAGLASVAAFMYRTFKCGVTFDLTGDRPRIEKNQAMSRGSTLILHRDGRQEYREGVTDADVASSVRSAMARAQRTELNDE